MTSVATLAMPFFGLIFLGFFCGKVAKLPEAGLQWMNFFIVYVALPALFFKLISVAPLEQLANWRFPAGTTLCTAIAFGLAFGIGMAFSARHVRASTIQALVGAYSNIGYMGPGLTLAVLGQAAIVPTALIFVFDTILFFSLVPFLMALGGRGEMRLGETARYVLKRIVTHPFNIATAIAVTAAFFHIAPPDPIDTMLVFLKNSAAPCALFTMGVTVALRPLRRVPLEIPFLLVIKLVLHPLLVWVILSWIGNFEREWMFTAIMMAALPPALNVFVLANQYRVYVEQASTAILLGTLASVFTVTSLLLAIAHDSIPYDLFP